MPQGAALTGNAPPPNMDSPKSQHQSRSHIPHSLDLCDILKLRQLISKSLILFSTLNILPSATTNPPGHSAQSANLMTQSYHPALTHANPFGGSQQVASAQVARMSSSYHPQLSVNDVRDNYYCEFVTDTGEKTITKVKFRKYKSRK